MPVKNYLSLIKFSHTIFALPFAIIGFCLGVVYKLDNPEFIIAGPNYAKAVYAQTDLYNYVKLFLLMLLCMIFARSAAMAFNRYLDRDIDSKNPRTAKREIPSGIISEKNALIFTILSSILFIVTTFFINKMCFYLSPIALFVILFYSYTKRFTALCHIVLGIGLGLAPIGAYLSVTGSFSLIPILFSLVVIFWVSGFDIIYALQDEGFDKENNLYSVPAIFGKEKGLAISSLLHAICGAIILYAGIHGKFTIWYWCGTLIFVGMIIYQHSIIKPNDLSRVNIAFMTANGIASIAFSIFVIIDIFAT